MGYAPWETPPAANAAPAAPPPTSTSYAPWETPPAAAPGAPGLVRGAQNYVSNTVGNVNRAFGAIDQQDTKGDTMLGPVDMSRVIGLGEFALKSVLGAGAPLLAVGTAALGNGNAQQYNQDLLDIRNQINLLPSNRFANGLSNVASATFQPVLDASHFAASQLTSDPQKQEALTTMLPYALSAAGGVRRPGEPVEVSSPAAVETGAGAIQRAKDLSDALQIPVTNGQLLRQGAKGANGSDVAGALNLPSQIERAVAGEENGVQLNNLFNKQQGQLTRAYQDTLNLIDRDALAATPQLRDWLTKANGLIDSSTPGMRTIDHTEVSSLLNDKNFAAFRVTNPELAGEVAARLRNISDFGDVIAEPVQSVQLTGQGTNPVLGAVARNSATVGTLAGMIGGALTGYHQFGVGGALGEFGLGGYGGHYLGELVRNRPITSQINRVNAGATNEALSLQDVRTMAQKAGVSTDTMAMELQKRGFTLK